MTTETIQTPAAAAAPTQPDFEAIKARQQATWASGDYAVVGTTLQIVGETLAEAVDIRAGEQVIDVAAGNGNATLAAARRYARVTSTDYVAALLDRGAARARAEGVDVTFQVADAEALPYEDASFDVGLSIFGTMFTPQPARSASELLRVVRSGGRIGLASWTPASVIGQLFKLIGSYLPPPAGVKSPALWGTESFIDELFGSEAADIRCARKQFNFRYHSPAHFLQVFREYYGPTHKAFGALDTAKQVALAAEITALLERHNVGGARALVVPSEYLEVVITRR